MYVLDVFADIDASFSSALTLIFGTLAIAEHGLRSFPDCSKNQGLATRFFEEPSGVRGAAGVKDNSAQVRCAAAQGLLPGAVNLR